MLPAVIKEGMNLLVMSAQGLKGKHAALQERFGEAHRIDAYCK